MKRVMSYQHYVQIIKTSNSHPVQTNSHWYLETIFLTMKSLIEQKVQSHEEHIGAFATLVLLLIQVFTVSDNI